MAEGRCGMSVTPYIVYLDPDTAFGNEILMFADNAPLIRCRDCDFYDIDDMGDFCTLHGFSEHGNMASSFCAWAERKVDE